MTSELLEELKAIGVEVIPQGENLAIRPASKVPPELKERLRAHKAEILNVLRERHVKSLAPCGSPNCGGCYEVEPGKRIHPPKASHDWLAWLHKWEPEGQVQ